MKLIDCISKVTIETGRKQKLYEGTSIEEGIGKILIGQEVIQNLLEYYGETLNEHFTDLNQYVEISDDKEDRKYTIKDNQFDEEVWKVVDLFVDLDAYFNTEDKRKSLNFSIAQWKQDLSILAKLKKTLDDDQDPNEEYKLDKNLQEVIRNGFQREDIKVYLDMREVVDKRIENMEDQSLREKYQDFTRNQLNQKSFMKWWYDESEEDKEEIMLLLQNLIEKFGEDEKRLKKHFDIYQIQISNTYYEKILKYKKNKKTIDLDEVRGHGMYPDIDMMKKYYNEHKIEIEEK